MATTQWPHEANSLHRLARSQLERPVLRRNTSEAAMLNLQLLITSHLPTYTKTPVWLVEGGGGGQDGIPRESKNRRAPEHPTYPLPSPPPHCQQPTDTLIEILCPVWVIPGYTVNYCIRATESISKADDGWTVCGVAFQLIVIITPRRTYRQQT